MGDWPRWYHCALPPLGIPLTILAAIMHPLIGGAVLLGTLVALVAILVFLVVGSPDFGLRTRVLLIGWNASPFVALAFLPIEWSVG